MSKEEVLVVNVSKELKEEVCRRATIEGVSRAELVRVAIREYFRVREYLNNHCK